MPEAGDRSTASAKAATDGDGEAGREQATVVRKLLKKMERKLTGRDVKASLGDYIRLVQLQKELDGEAPKEIKVTWVEPEAKTAETPETKSGSGE